MRESSRSRAATAEFRDRLPVVVCVVGVRNEWRSCSRLLLPANEKLE